MTLTEVDDAAAFGMKKIYVVGIQGQLLQQQCHHHHPMHHCWQCFIRVVESQWLHLSLDKLSVAQKSSCINKWAVTSCLSFFWLLVTLMIYDLLVCGCLHWCSLFESCCTQAHATQFLLSTKDKLWSSCTCVKREGWSIDLSSESHCFDCCGQTVTVGSFAKINCRNRSCGKVSVWGVDSAIFYIVLLQSWIVFSNLVLHCDTGSSEAICQPEHNLSFSLSL